MTPAAILLCLVVGITDGDTLKVRCGGEGAYQQVSVRLAEVDAPEKAQPFGRRSRASLAALCFGAVATVKPEKRDRYGRTVARVECRGKDASAEQARAGMAWYYVRYGTDTSVQALEGLAKGSRAGLWSDPLPVAPWDWRTAKRNRSTAFTGHPGALQDASAPSSWYRPILLRPAQEPWHLLARPSEGHSLLRLASAR